MIHKIKIEFVNGNLPHTYYLGKGPCGYTATDLLQTRDDHELTVTQWIEEHGEPATFVYPLRGVKRIAIYQYPEPAACLIPTPSTSPKT